MYTGTRVADQADSQVFRRFSLIRPSHPPPSPSPPPPLPLASPRLWSSSALQAYSRSPTTHLKPQHTRQVRNAVAKAQLADIASTPTQHPSRSQHRRHRKIKVVSSISAFVECVLASSRHPSLDVERDWWVTFAISAIVTTLSALRDACPMPVVFLPIPFALTAGSMPLGQSRQVAAGHWFRGSTSSRFHSLLCDDQS